MGQVCKCGRVEAVKGRRTMNSMSLSMFDTRDDAMVGEYWCRICCEAFEECFGRVHVRVGEEGIGQQDGKRIDATISELGHQEERKKRGRPFRDQDRIEAAADNGDKIGSAKRGPGRPRKKIVILSAVEDNTKCNMSVPIQETGSKVPDVDDAPKPNLGEETEDEMPVFVEYFGRVGGRDETKKRAGPPGDRREGAIDNGMLKSGSKRGRGRPPRRVILSDDEDGQKINAECHTSVSLDETESNLFKLPDVDDAPQPEDVGEETEDEVPVVGRKRLVRRSETLFKTPLTTATSILATPPSSRPSSPIPSPQKSTPSRRLALPSHIPLYHIDSRVQVRDAGRTWWPATIKEMRRGKVRVEYEGWGSEFDEWLDVESQRLRVESFAGAVPPKATRAADVEANKGDDESRLAMVPSDGTTQLSTIPPQASSHIQPTSTSVPSGPAGVLLVGRSVRTRKRPTPKEQDSTPSATVEPKPKPTPKKRVKKTTPKAPKAKEPIVESPPPLPPIDISTLPPPLTLQLPSAIHSQSSSATRRAANNTARAAYLDRKTLATEVSMTEMKKVLGVGARVVMVEGPGGAENADVYVGTVVKRRSWQVLIHYDGWDSVWDEWVDMNSSKLRLLTSANDPTINVPPTKPRSKKPSSSQQQKDPDSDDPTAPHWKISCNKCFKRIRQFRYFCTYCEVPSEGYSYESFDLCLDCFVGDFPVEHPHPFQGFAVEAIGKADGTGGAFAEDMFDESCVAAGCDTTGLGDVKSVIPRCAFCDSERTDIVGGFIGPHPFRNPFITSRRKRLVKASTTGGITTTVMSLDAMGIPPGRGGGGDRVKPSGKRVKLPVVWAHETCAKFSPEVCFVPQESGSSKTSGNGQEEATIAPAGRWFNVVKAVIRGRGVKCCECKEKGATIGCFDPSCSRSYHLACTKKSLSFFEEGVIFWCPRHQEAISRLEKYEEVYSCDRCQAPLGEEEEKKDDAKKKRRKKKVDGAGAKGTVSGETSVSLQISASVPPSTACSTHPTASTTSGLPISQSITYSPPLPPGSADQAFLKAAASVLAPAASSPQQCWEMLSVLAAAAGIGLGLPNRGGVVPVPIVTSGIQSHLSTGTALINHVPALIVNPMPSNIYSNILPMSRPSSVPSTLTTTTSPLTNLPLGSINIPANHAPLWNNPYLTNIASLPIGQLFSRVNSTMESTGVIGTSPVAPSGVVPQMGQGIIPYVPSLTTPLLQLVGNVRPTLVNSSVGVCILPRVVSGHTLPSVGPTIVTATESLPMVAVAGTDATSAAPTAEEVPLEPPPPPKPKPHPTWHTCLPCRTNSHFSSFDLCPPCFTTHEESTHLHPIPSFSITNLRERKLQRQAEAKKRKADMAQRADERRLAMAERRKRREERVRDVVGAGIGVMNGLGGVRCAYCWVELTEGWRKGYNGIPMCEACFKLAASTFDVEEDKQDEEVPQSGTTASAEAEIHPESSSVEATAEQPEQQQRYDSGSPEVNTGSNVGDSEPVQTPPQRSDPDPIEVEPERHIIEDAPTMDQAQLLISKNITEPSAEGGENVNLHNEVQSLSSQELESPVAEDVIDTNRDQNATAAARVLDPTSLRGVYSTELEAYSHEYYLTRGVVGKASAGSGHSGTVAYEMSANGAILDSGTGSGQQNSVFKDPKRDFETLSSYAPTDDHLFTLRFDTSFYDIPGRAPRWATHSGGDYHGTWLPQVVRMSLLRYTRPGARVLSNFSGRGTDAIEAFLCRRKLCAVDINPASVALSQRNVSFAIPPTSDLSAAYRPVIVCADSRNLVGSLFAAASYDHVLSHPPYKDCISYSAHIEGDLSHFPDPLVFQSEMRKVALETYRLLKPHKRVTLGMGDNRRDCFYQPVSFDTIKTYMDVGFEVESLIVKRQRYCQMAPLGTWLCTRYDFLMFTHEFVAILRKKEWSSIQDGECLTEDGAESEDVSNNLHEIERTQRRIPTSPIDRSSIVMGTVWTFTTCAEYALSRLAMSKIVERFGKDGGVWEEIGFSALENHVLSQVVYHDICQNPETDEERETTEIGNVEEEEEVDVMTAYERRRRDQLVKNNRELLSMGLISDLSPEGQDDASSLSTLLSIPTLPKNALHSPHLVFVPHINVPPTGLVKKDWIPGYRRMLQRLATEVEPRVEVGGYLIVGVKDVHVILDEGGETRDTEPTSSTPPSPQTKFIPLGLLVNEDLTAQFANSDSSQSTSRFRLKDFIVAVPDGLAKSKSLSIDILKRQVAQDEVEWKLENETDVRRLAPIVHAYYFVYMKV